MAYSTEELLERAKDIRKTEYQVPPRGVIIPDYISGPKYNKWLNDIKIKAASLPDDCPLKKELNSAYFFKDSSTSTFDRMIGLLESLLEWENDYKKVLQEVNMKKMQTKEYDVFLSHANADKNDYVDELYKILLSKGYPKELCAEIAYKNMNTDYTATRMLGYLYRYTNPKIEDLVDEMLAILSDEELGDKITMEQYYYNHMNKAQQAAYHSILSGVKNLVCDCNLWK